MVWHRSPHVCAADNAAHTVQGQLRLSAAEVKTTAFWNELQLIAYMLEQICTFV